jgi:membrane peptidoglycan carboxypeptidase
VVADAFVSAEDRNFWEHQGYDPRAIAAAFVEAVQTRGQSVRGASTITQQVMKNFLLDGSRTIERKVREIILAARIEGRCRRNGFSNCTSTRSSSARTPMAWPPRRRPISTHRSKT